MKSKSSPMIIQGAILACAGILTKLIGFAYRIPMANMLGEEGNGIYSVAFGIYNVALTLSSYSLPLAVSKIISKRIAKKQYANSFNAFLSALAISVIAGILSFSFLFFGADLLENLYNTKGLCLPLKVLAPTTFVVALLGTFRGFFQGHGNMVPTALSQIIEQVINALVSIVATYFSLKIYSDSAHGAQGATMGTLAGAVFALIFIMLLFTSRLSYTKKSFERGVSHSEKRLEVIKEIIWTMVPIIISQTIYQISFTIDDLLFSNIMHSNNFSSAAISSLQGVFNTQYTQLINIPIAVSTALAASTLPAIVRLSVKGEKDERQKKIETVIKITSAISLPCAVGLSVFALPIVTLVFPGLVTYRAVAANLLVYGSLGCVFYSISTITTSILQGCNRMRIPVVNAFIAFVIHTALIYTLLDFTPLGIYARLIADVTFPLIILVLNILQLKSKFNLKLSLKKTIVFPLICSGVMGIVSACLYVLLKALTSSMIISFVSSIIVAVAVYGIALIKLQVFSNEEYLELPMGRKLMRLSDKINK